MKRIFLALFLTAWVSPLAADKKIISYDIVCSTNMDLMHETIEGNIKDGWQPLGGISITAMNSTGSTYEYMYCQAIVKYSK